MPPLCLPRQLIVGRRGRQPVLIGLGHIHALLKLPQFRLDRQ